MSHCRKPNLNTIVFVCVAASALSVLWVRHNYGSFAAFAAHLRPGGENSVDPLLLQFMTMHLTPPEVVNRMARRLAVTSSSHSTAVRCRAVSPLSPPAAVVTLVRRPPFAGLSHRRAPGAAVSARVRPCRFTRSARVALAFARTRGCGRGPASRARSRRARRAGGASGPARAASA